MHAMQERGYSIPVVLITGHPMHEELDDLHALGLKAWIQKPPNLKQLSEVVAQALT